MLCPRPVVPVSLRATRAVLLAMALALLAFAAGAADAPDKSTGASAANAGTGDPATARATAGTAGDAGATNPAGAKPAAAQAKAGLKADADEAPIDGERLLRAVVKVSARAVPNARSEGSLGRVREGTGVVIGNDGLILTIGYLIVEADDVQVTDARGRTIPAQVVGYDQASGFGLVRALVPIDADPIAFGDSNGVPEHEPVLIASADGEGVAFAYVVSKRAFTGNWEYRLDSALYTSPPMLSWSGAALIDRNGKLLGIGSLIVREATEDTKLPGNVFVPIDLLKPILGDMVREGHRAGPARPWLGITADEVEGRLLVRRVSPDGPADRAGLQPGDVIVGVGASAVSSQADFYRQVWDSGAAGDEVVLKVLQGGEVREIRVRSMDRVQYFRPRTTV